MNCLIDGRRPLAYVMAPFLRSLHYERDAWLAGQVRNSNVIASEDEYGFIDGVEWESIKRQGEDAIKRWINHQLKNTSVTAVLIGEETADREWARYEIVESWNRGNGLVGIRIHNMLDHDRKTDAHGRNPFELFTLPNGTRLSAVCKIYDWLSHDGRANCGKWLEEAVEIRSKYGSHANVSEDTKERARIAVKSDSGGFVPRSLWCPDAHARR